MAVGSIRFIFLGTGTSGGIPIIACDCATCRSDDPRDVRSRQGAALQWVDPLGRHRTVLIDATPDLRHQALRHDLQRCDAILFTHHHADHIFGLDEVRRFNAVMQAPIDIYAEPATLGHLRRVYPYIFDPETNENRSFVATLKTHDLAVGTPVELFGVRFEPVRLMHGNLPILGFRIEAADAAMAASPGAEFLPMAYCTDTSLIPEEMWGRLGGLRTLVLDGLRYQPHGTHFNVEQACEAAARIGADQTYLCHIAHELKHQEADAALPPGVSLPWDGLVLGDARFTEPRASMPPANGAFAEG
ncbi:MAG: MBL fold metallo-hydrolase [Planctomycetota bacterium]